jgi:hypothetical protein
MSTTITAQHLATFDLFGYVVIRGLFAEDITWITDEYEAVWRTRPDLMHSAAGKNSAFPGLFISRSARLSALLEDPRIVALGDTLLGEGYSLSGGDGGRYNGDTSFHTDMPPQCWQAAETVKHLKICFYLDPLRRDTGALRVIPGSHLTCDRYSAQLQQLVEGATPVRMRTRLGLDHAELPSQALESRPGDVIIFDHRLLHGSFGGGFGRRMFDLNLHGPVRDDGEREAALAYYRCLRDPPYNVDWCDFNTGFGPGWVESLSAARSRHLASLFSLGAEVMHEKAMGEPVLRPV